MTSLMIAFAIILGVFYKTDSKTAPPSEPIGSDNKPSKRESKFYKAVWLSQYDLSPVYLSGGVQREIGEFSSMIEKILDNCESLGFNTLIVQLRPNGDSIYPSELYPSSAYAVGNLGEGFLYDPFELILSLAKKRNFSVHGWINPLRLMTRCEMENASGNSEICRLYRDPQTREECFFELDGRLYLNPASKKARELISDGAAEIVKKYDVDGVHMDDYFLPHDIGVLDLGSYISSSTNLSLGDWRRENISALLSLIYKKVKNEKNDALFGVSPGGNLETAVNTDYADVKKWCAEEGYIDYICPQIYFGMEHETHAFDKVYEQWESIPRLPDISLFAGISFHKVGAEDKYAGSGVREWIENSRVLADCLEFLEGKNSLSGIAVFSYHLLFDQVTGQKKENTKGELESFLPVWKEF